MRRSPSRYSMVMGSSCRPAILASCISALPMEVVRRVTWIDLPCTSGVSGVVVMVPSQEPARAFSLSKDFCASDWANAMAGSNIRTAIRNSGFICNLLLRLAPTPSPPRKGWKLDDGYCVILNYNSISVSRDLLEFRVKDDNTFKNRDLGKVCFEVRK